MAAPISEEKRLLLAYYQTYPHLVHGNSAKGEIQVVTDLDQIARIEAAAQAAFERSGHSPEVAFKWSRVGIVSEGAYFLQFRDAVTFPNGTTGVYDRQLERSALAGFQGAVVLPLLGDGRILFNLTYRHAIDRWDMELARGFSKPQEPPIATARRELKEETGSTTEDPIPLGIVAPNTGAAAVTPSIYLCHVNGSGPAQRGKEAIDKCIPFTPQEVADALVNGYFVHEGTKVPFICGFSFSALLKAQAAGHINLPQGRKAIEEQPLPSSQ